MKESAASYRITDLAPTDRPRERLAEAGAVVLSNAELLAILLRVGVQGENAVQMGHRLLMTLGGLRGLRQASFHEICSQHGMGAAKAAQIIAAIELGRRIALDNPDDRPAIHSPKDAADLVMYEMAGFNQEHLWVILTDIKNKVIQIEKIYKGSLNSSTVRIGELFKTAVVRNAACILMVHNHPSGDPTPSPEDIALTRAVIQAGKLLDIDVLDHIVIGANRFVSLKERGLAFGTRE